MQITKKELSEFIQYHMKAVEWDKHQLSQATGITVERLTEYIAARQLPRKLDHIIFLVREAVKKEIRRRRDDRQAGKWELGS